MDNKRITAIQKVFSRTESITLRGKYKGLVVLSPPELKSTKSISPGIPRAEIFCDLNKNLQILHTSGWAWGTDGDERKLGIFQSGLEFPENCCDCMGNVDHYTVVEITKQRKSVSFDSQDMEQEKRKRTATSLSSDRFWFAIPFCNVHDVESRPVTIASVGDDKKSKARIDFSNREYAKLFASKNNLEGRWFSRKYSANYRTINSVGLMGMAIGFFMALFSIFSIMADLKKGFDLSVGAVSVVILGLVVFVVSLTAVRKTNLDEGDPLTSLL